MSNLLTLPFPAAALLHHLGFSLKMRDRGLEEIKTPRAFPGWDESIVIVLGVLDRC